MLGVFSEHNAILFLLTNLPPMTPIMQGRPELESLCCLVSIFSIWLKLDPVSIYIFQIDLVTGSQN